ncbi:MAG: DEAD/DEAH box helicase, partial [Deltaproteobacteria bacterium]|nr:DEAD/DEAH box helicase [Deltaproteobacteria bacterium]
MGPSLGHCTPVKKNQRQDESPAQDLHTEPTVEGLADEELLVGDSEEGEPVVIEDEVGFEALGLPPRLLQIVTKLGFKTPTTIQEVAIPPLLEGRDVVGQARTGTGKTAAFGLPLIARLFQTRGKGAPRALVLTPTRELALQVTDALRSMSEGLGLRLTTVYGGSPYGAQLRALREGVDIVIGTPGRVIDLMDRESLRLGEVEVVVLDEADEMLEMGFIDAVESIVAKTPETRQVALFSATMPPAIRKVADRYLKNPVSAREEAKNVLAISQRFVCVPPRWRPEALLRLLRSEVRDATLVFAGTRVACAEAADFLAANGIPAEPLHGDMNQAARERVVELLRQRRVEVVVATDIAARGIDIDHLTHIINLDLPKNVEVYTHRIGRTGRAGRTGTAVTLVAPRDVGRFTDVLMRRGVVLEELYLPTEADLDVRAREAVVQKLGEFKGLDAAVVADAQRWAESLVGEGRAFATAEELMVAALGRLAEGESISLGRRLDTTLPPWARRPTKVEPKPAKSRQSRDDGPEGGVKVVAIGVGRRDGVRPADLVGALTNELGLSGSEIGRLDIGESRTLVEVTGAFAARLGNEAWPLQVRRQETTVRVHDMPVEKPQRPQRPREDVREAGPQRGYEARTEVRP